VDKLIENLPAIIGAAAQSHLGMLALLSVALSVLAYFFFSGASEKVKVGIFVLLFFGVLGFGAAMFLATPKAQEPTLTDATPAPSPSSHPAPVSREDAGMSKNSPKYFGQVRAGHYVFKLLGTMLEPYSTDTNGNPQKFSLRLSIRVTDVSGMSDYVDRRTIRLLVDGAELLPENSINFAVYERQSAETEAVFIVPADASSVELLLGRPEAATGKLPLALNFGAR
jgi:hypothetical protein